MLSNLKKGDLMDWIKEINAAVTVSDANGIIVYMNQASIKTFEKYGGASLIGRSLLDVHPEPALTKLKKMIQEKTTNAYTIEKNGRKKLIYQTPWFKNGKFLGYIEISIEIPTEMPHYIRS